MKRRVVLAAVAAAVAAVAAVLGGPVVLRQLDFFAVRQVELVGLRYLAPDVVLDALALEDDRHLFDDSDAVAERAAGIPGVVSARVVRRLPGTLRIEFVEREPVAFAPGPAGLVAVDADGRPLPYDATAGGLDLPLVPRVDDALVRTLAVIRAVDGALYQELDGARRGAGETVILELGPRQVLLNATTSPSEIRAVEAVRRHLAETGRPFDQLDGRFAGWIVVRRGGV